MKKSMKIPLLMAIVTCIISISGSYAATNYAISATKIGYSDNSNLGVDNVQAAIDGTCTKFSSQLTNLKNEVKTETLNEMYPVGSIYISTILSTKSQVASSLGGTWETFGDGKVLRSSTYKSEQTGGSSTATLTTANLPSHSHSYTPSGTVNSTFIGESSTTSESGSHSHHMDGWAIKWGNLPNRTFVDTSMVYGTSTANNPYVSVSSTDSTGIHSHTVTAKGTVSSTFAGTAATTTATGSGTKFSTIDPYITVYMYKRTA